MTLPGARNARRAAIREETIMGAHQDLAVAAMHEYTRKTKAAPDFMTKAGLDLPSVTIPGSLPATTRFEVTANDLHLPTDIELCWTIGDYPGEKDYSAYYDPHSPWYNVFFGSYAMRSYKPDGTAWGYTLSGEANFDEFFEIPKIDYNNFVAGQFHCPPEKMCFEVLKKEVSSTKVDGWDFAQFDATIPSGLHNAARTLGNPESYVVYGVPNNELLEHHEEFEKIYMHGEMYMRRVKSLNPEKVSQPLTVAFGVACQQNGPAQDLRAQIMTALRNKYLHLYPQE
jgi:hypothetical protein